MLPIIFPTFIKIFAKILWDVCHLISKSCVSICRFTWLFPRNNLYLSTYLLIGSLTQTTLTVHCSTSYNICLLGPLRCLIDMHALSTLYRCKKNYLINLPSPGFPQQSFCWISGEIFDLRGWQVSPTLTTESFQLLCSQADSPKFISLAVKISQRCCTLCFDHIHKLLLTDGNSLIEV